MFAFFTEIENGDKKLVETKDDELKERKRSTQNTHETHTKQEE